MFWGIEIDSDVKLICSDANELSSLSDEIKGSLGSESSNESKGVGRMCLAARSGRCGCAEGKKRARNWIEKDTFG